MKITPNQLSFAPAGKPPVFKVETDGRPFFAVQVATEALLFNGANASRRSQTNFFDSWFGDDRVNVPGHRARREVAGEHLDSPAGRGRYTLPLVVWKRLLKGKPSRLFYRVQAFTTERRAGLRSSVPDASWRKAPALTVAVLPAQPPRSPTGAFRGKVGFARPDLLTEAVKQLAKVPIVYGRDRDWRYAILKASAVDMTVIECHERGLTDTVKAMPRKPLAVINGQFLSSIFGIGTEGQVVRERMLINADSRDDRYYVAQRDGGVDVASFRLGLDDPATQEPDARAAFGGLGPILKDKAPVPLVTQFAKSIYAKSADTGRGAIAVHRGLGLILLAVQQNNSFYSDNALTMTELRDRLQALGCDDAVFNDGSDSEALFAGGGWLLDPALKKDETMDFAVGFVERARNRRLRMLAIDGTLSIDAESFAAGLARPAATHYAPRNLAPELKELPSLQPIAATFRSGIIEAHRATDDDQMNLVRRLVELGGASPGLFADFLYVSTHSSRHGELWVSTGGVEARPHRPIAGPWLPGFSPRWTNTPRWLIIAGCGVLAPRYARTVSLSALERSDMNQWHQEIHGAGTAVPGLTPDKDFVLAVYHPGVAWHDRIFRRSPALRGVLGYWWRSPAHGKDVEIIQDFAERLAAGEAVLAAWERVNRGLFGLGFGEAAWAAMVRAGCEEDTLATLEDPTSKPPAGDFRYYDVHQRGKTIRDAYTFANATPDVEEVAGIKIRNNEDYDEEALDRLKEVAGSVTLTNFLRYNDGVAPA